MYYSYVESLYRKQTNSMTVSGQKLLKGLLRKFKNETNNNTNKEFCRVSRGGIVISAPTRAVTHWVKMFLLAITSLTRE